MTPQSRADDAQQQFVEYIAALFSLSSEHAVTEQLRLLTTLKPFRIRIKLLYSRSRAIDLLHNIFQDIPRPSGRLSENGPGFLLRRLREGVPAELVHFAVLSTDQAHVSAVVSVSLREDWRFLQRFLRGHYPTLVPIYLSQRELLEGVSVLERKVHQHHDLRVRELTAKETLRTPVGKTLRSLREWTDEEWKTTLGQVSERRQTITSVALAFHRRIADKTDVLPAAMCKVTKRGEVDFTAGYDLMWDTVIAHVAEIGERKLSFYSKRGLRETEFVPRPLAITYSKPVFSEVEEVRRLVGVLTEYPRSMHAVQHGNPYVYVQVADAIDGSAFDIWALSPEKIALIPRLKVTEAALNRLIHYIFDEFREGKVEDYAGEQ